MRLGQLAVSSWVGGASPGRDKSSVEKDSGAGSPEPLLLSGNVLISVTTFDSEKTIYYVDYSGGLWVKKYEYDKRFGNRKKAFQRVHAIYPKRYTNKKNVIIYSR